MSCVSETCEKYEVATCPSPVEHLELHIRLNLDKLGFDRSPALTRATVLGKSCGGDQDKDSHPDLSAHFYSLHRRPAILPHQVFWPLSGQSKDEV